MSSPAIYRTYDRAGLDAQYNNRARVPDHEAHSARWARESQQARTELKCKLDLAYGPAPAERMDVFLGDRPNAPVLMFIHGGYWMSRDKADFSFVVRPFVQAGVTVAMVNYALAPTVTVAEIVRQNRAAAAYLWKEAASLGIDRNRIYVGGHSAGGHLTVMLLTTDWPAFAPGLPAQLVKGGAAISGIFDMEPMRLCYLNDSLHLDAAQAQALSPLFNLPKTAPPLIAAVGGAESPEFLRQNAEMAKAWKAQGWRVQELVSPGKDHFTVLGQMVAPKNPLTKAILSMIEA